MVPEIIKNRYEILNMLGEGSYGQVFRCFDLKEKKEISLKVSDITVCLTKQNKYREAVFLKQLKNSSIIRFEEDFVIECQHFLVLEYMSKGSLWEVFMKGALPLANVQRYARSVMEGLKFLKKKGVVHADIKAANILVKNHEMGTIKLVDFGLSFFENEPVDHLFSTQGYRAPELLLNLRVGTPLDMWSAGCVFAELSTGQQLLPCCSDLHEIVGITEILGKPPREMLIASPKCYEYFDVCGRLNLECRQHKTHRCPLNQFLGSRDLGFLEFINSILCWNPDTRCTPASALKHSWMNTTSALAPEHHVALAFDADPTQPAPAIHPLPFWASSPHPASHPTDYARLAHNQAPGFRVGMPRQLSPAIIIHPALLTTSGSATVGPPDCGHLSSSMFGSLTSCSGSCSIHCTMSSSSNIQSAKAMEMRDGDSIKAMEVDESDSFEAMEVDEGNSIEAMEVDESDSFDTMEVCEGDSVDAMEVCEGDSIEAMEVDEGDSFDTMKVCEGDSVDAMEVDEGDSIEAMEVDEGDSFDTMGVCEGESIDTMRVYKGDSIDRMEVCEGYSVDAMGVCEGDSINTMGVCEGESIDTMEVYKGESIDTMGVYKGESIDTMGVCEGNSINTMGVCEGESVNTLEVCEGDSIDTMGVCECESINTKEVCKGKSIDTMGVYKGESIDTMGVYEGDSIDTMGVCEGDSIDTMGVCEGESINTKEVCKGDYIDTMGVCEGDSINTMGVYEGESVNTKEAYEGDSIDATKASEWHSLASLKTYTKSGQPLHAEEAGESESNQSQSIASVEISADDDPSLDAKGLDAHIEGAGESQFGADRPQDTAVSAVSIKAEGEASGSHGVASLGDDDAEEGPSDEESREGPSDEESREEESDKERREELAEPHRRVRPSRRGWLRRFGSALRRLCCCGSAVERD